MKTNRSALLLATLWIAAPVHALRSQGNPPTQGENNAPRDTQGTEAYLARIAKAKLLFEVEGDAAAAERELEKIRDDSMHQVETAPGTFDGTSVLLELSLARIQLLIDLGRTEEARAGLVETADVESAKNAPLVSRPWRTALAQAASQDARVARLQARLESLAGSGANQTVEELVDQFAEAGRFDYILQLGTRAVPALKARILANLDRFSENPGHDELATLVQIDEVAAGQLVLAHADEGGTLWRGRILRAMNFSPGTTSPAYGVLGDKNDEAWEYAAGFPCNCRRRHWVEVLERLVAMPDVSAEAIRMVRPLVLHGAITPSLEEALIDAIQSNEPKRVQAALFALDSPYWTPGVERALEVAVASESPHVRVFAANQLARYDESAALQARVDDPEAGVRRALARTLTERDENVPEVYQGRIILDERTIHPTLGEPERVILARLATDPDTQVRGSVVSALAILDSPPDAEVIMELVADPDAEIRTRMAHLARSLPPELQARALLALAADENRRVLSAIDGVLATEPWDRPDLLLPVLRARQVHGVHPVTASREWATIRSKATGSDLGLNQVVDWAIEDRDSDLILRLIQGSPLRLDGERMGRLLPFLFKVDTRACAKYVEDIRREAPNGAHFRPALVALARDEALSPGLRFLAASCLASEGGEMVVDVMTDALRHPAFWASEREKGRKGFYSLVDDFVEDVPAADRNRILLALVRDEGADSDLAGRMVRKCAWEGPSADAITQAILDRWFVAAPASAVGPGYAVRDAIRRMGWYPASADSDLLARALERVEYRGAALDAIGKIHDPALLPALERLLQSPGDSDWLDAVEAVTNYMSDEAAELLVSAATRAGSQEGRAACLAGLDAIRSFQDARDHFATRRTSRQTRESAVTDLLGMLDSENAEVRLQAIRALATFEAVESIPRLIGMLPNADEETAKALRETLDRLNGLAQSGEK